MTFKNRKLYNFLSISINSEFLYMQLYAIVIITAQYFADKI